MEQLTADPFAHYPGFYMKPGMDVQYY